MQLFLAVLRVVKELGFTVISLLLFGFLCNWCCVFLCSIDFS
jgi:hypothetical protein